MGKCFSGISPCCRINKTRRVFNVLLLGLSGTGKTEIGHILSKKRRTDTTCTNGVRAFKCSLKKDILNMTEIGGNPEMLKIWHYYYPKAMAVMYVIDISEQLIMEHGVNLLHEVMKHVFLSRKPFLIVASKADLRKDITSLDLEEFFCLEEYANRYDCPTRLILWDLKSSQDELFDGVNWLKEQLDANYTYYKNRVSFDTFNARRDNLPLRIHRRNNFRYQFDSFGREVHNMVHNIRPHSALILRKSATSLRRSYRKRTSKVAPCEDEIPQKMSYEESKEENSPQSTKSLNESESKQIQEPIDQDSSSSNRESHSIITVVEVEVNRCISFDVDTSRTDTIEDSDSNAEQKKVDNDYHPKETDMKSKTDQNGSLIKETSPSENLKRTISDVDKIEESLELQDLSLS